MMVLNAGHFAGLGVWHVPKYLTVWECRRIPKRPKGFCGATSELALFWDHEGVPAHRRLTLFPQVLYRCELKAWRRD
jgi:hypothetical protein